MKRKLKMRTLSREKMDKPGFESGRAQEQNKKWEELISDLCESEE